MFDVKDMDKLEIFGGLRKMKEYDTYRKIAIKANDLSSHRVEMNSYIAVAGVFMYAGIPLAMNCYGECPNYGIHSAHVFKIAYETIADSCYTEREFFMVKWLIENIPTVLDSYYDNGLSDPLFREDIRRIAKGSVEDFNELNISPSNMGFGLSILFLADQAVRTKNYIDIIDEYAIIYDIFVDEYNKL